MAAAKRHRSPKNPSVSLRVAIEKSERLLRNAGRGPVAYEVAIRGMGMSPNGSAGKRALAALSQFGLWERAPDGVKLSDLGRRVLLEPDPDSADRKAAIREAALAPDVNRRAFDQWPDGLPGQDTGMKGILQVQWGFNPSATGKFISQLRDTFDLAEVYTSNGPHDESPDNEPTDDGRTVDLHPQLGSWPKPPTAEPSFAGISGDDRKMKELPLPLIDSGTAVLRFPHPMTEDDFEFLTFLLKKLKGRLVAAKTDGVEDENDDPQE